MRTPFCNQLDRLGRSIWKKFYVMHLNIRLLYLQSGITYSVCSLSSDLWSEHTTLCKICSISNCQCDVELAQRLYSYICLPWCCSFNLYFSNFLLFIRGFYSVWSNFLMKIAHNFMDNNEYGKHSYKNKNPERFLLKYI